MSAQRDEMLTEMGLAPRWRLRERASIPLEDATIEQREPQVSLRNLPSSANAGDMCMPVEAASPPKAGTIPEIGAPPPASRAGDERRAAIMRMDWTALKQAVGACVDCALHAKRNKTVFGVGGESADWMFVGEGPGADEDAQGEPFVGQAGKLLDNMLAAIKLGRAEKNVYICNVVKCRPPGNRNPEAEEALKCEPYLHRQIELVKPKLIVALGRVAALNLLAREASIASLRGRVLEYRGTPLIVTYHPAYLLRNLTDKAKTWEDLCFAARTMAHLQSQASAPI